jgi:hypothetical protein
MEKKNEVKSGKKSLWAMLKESMTKASSGCGPGCGCHVEERIDDNRQKDKPVNSGNAGGQA